MFEFTASIDIQASPKTTWGYLSDVEGWWVASNPEHESLEIVSGGPDVKEGTVLRICEKVAGIPAVAEGPVCEIVEGSSVTWKADAVYRLFGMRFPVKEGVTWRITPKDEKCKLSANVWAEFPNSLFGQVSEWIFKHILNGVAQDYKHAICELRYIKQRVEHLQS